MTTQMKFDASARHEMTAYPAFRVKGYELHVFKAPGTTHKKATAEDVTFVPLGPGLGGGSEHGDASQFPGPEDRAVDARYKAERSGRDVCVVAYDMDETSPQNNFTTSAASPRAETKVFKLGAYEAHVHYPEGCTHKTLAEENVRVFDDLGLIGTEDHEMDNTMDGEDRAARAGATFVTMKRDGNAKAVAFFVGRLGQEQTLDAKTLTPQINRAAGTPSLEDDLAALANTKLAEKPTSLFKRVWGAISPRATA